MSKSFVMSETGFGKLGVAMLCLIVNSGCEDNRDSPGSVRQTMDNSCPYTLTLVPVTTKHGEVTVDLSVENVSNRVVGWDSEFSAGILIYLRIVPDAKADKTAPGFDSSRDNLLEPERLGPVPDKDRLNRARFIMLKPGERLTKRIGLTDKFRLQDEVLVEFPPPGGVKHKGVESYLRYRIPESACAFDVEAILFSGSPTFFQSFGVWPGDVKIENCGRLPSNSVRIKKSQKRSG